ncbi:MAG: UDP-2,3-diacylglucosamine diphosphatase [Bacteroidetes bacterium]|nr:UDP-2,3-diacylglucosamine diphosphatase [Bacteroidota bacterium]
MKITASKKVYFLSDSHLGIPNHTESLKREKHIVSFLDSIKNDASELFLLGDIFDFWFEYKTVVPKGFVRLLGKLAELSDSGINIHYFTGNHDMWAFRYFEKELGVKMYRKPICANINNKQFLIGHGDGLGPGDNGYKRLRKIFASRICQKLFSYIHPGFGTKIALFFSKKSRLANGISDEIFLGEEKERLIQYCKDVLRKEHYDFFLFGHRHLPMEIQIKKDVKYINTGDWFKNYSYVVWDGEKLELKYFPINK